MKTIKRVSMAATFCAAMVATAVPSWATSYTYTFSVADLLSYDTNPSGSDSMTAADVNMLDGARRITLSNGTNYSSWIASTSADFVNELNTSGYALGMFNLWGYGGTDAEEWGETYNYTAWSYNDGTASDVNWVSFLYTDSDETSGNTVLAFARTAAGDAIALDGSTDNLTFTFTIDLPDDTSWLYGVEGQLTFWFGGILVANATDVTAEEVGKFQGNMTLTGVAAVPEPTTMLLFGTGLMGLAFTARRRLH